MENNSNLPCQFENEINLTKSEMSNIRQELKLTKDKFGKLEITNKRPMTNCQRCKERSKSLREEIDDLNKSNKQLKNECENMKQKIMNSDKRNLKSLQAFKQENDELRSERFELLNQMQEMQKTIDDKEDQLREFIKEFHIQTKENEQQLREADDERIRISKERSELSRSYDNLKEKVETLRSQLTKSEAKTREFESELLMLKQSYYYHGTNQKRRSAYIPFSTDELVISQRQFSLSNSINETSQALQAPLHTPALFPSTPSGQSGKFVGVDSLHHINGNHSVSSPLSNGNDVTTTLQNSCGSSNNDLSNDDVINDGNVFEAVMPNGHSNCTVSNNSKKNGVSGKHQNIVQSLSGSLSRAFKRRYGSTRKSLDASHFEQMIPVKERCGLFDKNGEEKKQMLSAIHNTPMLNWKAEDVAVWLDLHMHMSQYVGPSLENVKSGKVLLGLSECEIEKELGMEKQLHKRKLIMALNEFRNPNTTLANMTSQGNLDHWWVSEQWLNDVSLSQYASKFREHLVDGRVLASLSRKELDKIMGIHDKSHQESLLCGIKLLKMFNFDVKRLDERRQINEGKDCDLLIWNCSRLIQWIKSIDLKEYATNLSDSGIHGALIVLNPNFSVDDVADSLGIPQNKTSVRRHLASEIDSLVNLARTSLEDEFHEEMIQPFVRATNQRKSKGIRSSFTRSISRTLRDSNGK